MPGQKANMRWGKWVGAQLDAGITIAGVLMALGLMLSCVGAVLALSAGSIVFASLFGAAFLVLFGLFFAAVRATDPNKRLSAQQRRELWNKAPAYARHAIVLLVGANVVGFLLGEWMDSRRIAHGISLLALGLSSLVIAEGVRKHRPALPRPNAEPLDPASPDYPHALRKTLLSLYACAAMTLALGAVSVLE
jgi:hypothetical protein